MTRDAIRLEGLQKTYAGGKQALRGIDLDVPAGSIFGLLGPNGAGKSTLINILAGLVTKTAGAVSIWGWDQDRNPRQSRAAIGVMPQELNLDPFFTPRGALEVQAGLYGVPKDQRRSDEILEMVGLTDKAEAYARTLSGGMRRRLLLAKALVHRPQVLVLDEPTAGVDIELRRMLWDNVRRLNRDAGMTIILTTHYLEEAEEMADRVGIIDHGRLLLVRDKEELMHEFGQKVLTVELAEPLTALPAALEGQGLVLSPDSQSVSYRYDSKADRSGIARLLSAFAAEGVAVRDIHTEQSSLEEVFLRLVRELA